MTRAIDLKFRDVDDDIKRDRVHDSTFSSQDLGEGWSAFFSDFVHDSSLDNGTGWCYEDPAFPYEASTYHSEVAGGSFSGAGLLSAVVALDAQSNPAAFIFALGQSHDQTSTVEYMDACGTISTGSSTYGSGGIDASPDPQTACREALQLATVTVQAFNGSCSDTTTVDHQGTATTTTTTTWTWRFRRVECDTTIDTDGDDLADCTEYALGTDPSNPDTDGDGLSDGDEVLSYGTDPKRADTDGDGLSDKDEVLTYGTDPNNPDTDGDGVSDGIDPCRLDAGPVGSNGCPPGEDPDPDPDPEPDPDPAIAFAYSMPAQTLDANHDGRVDYIGGNRSADVPVDGRYPVKLNACGAAAASYSWTLFGPQGTTRIITPSADCSPTVALDEGLWSATLHAVGGALKRPQIVTQPVTVKNYLVVSLGDSYASGEGVPDQPSSRPKVPPRWAHRDCHRSAYAASTQAAFDLENADPQTSVTFIHLACSGATIYKGLLGEYAGAEKDGVSNVAQVTVARQLTHGQPVDALMVSIGGNDVGFADIIKNCMLKRRNCYDDKVTIDGKTGKLHKVSQKLLRRLVGRYATLAKCLTTGSCAGQGGATVGSITAIPNSTIAVGYPDLTKGRSGKYCDDHGALRADEYEWADKAVLAGQKGKTIQITEKGGFNLHLTANGLNPQIRSLATKYGWRPVTSHYKTFERHGYCADERSWIRSIDQSLVLQRNEKGGFHPNMEGQEAIAQAVLPTLRSILGAD